MMKLTILICTIEGRANYLKLLLDILEPQLMYRDVQILTNSSNDLIGKKRNELLQAARGEYVCFIDDDDIVSSDYIDTLFKCIDGGFDCCSLRGVITWDGETPEVFEHSIKYSAYATTTNPIKYERYPNHLNCIKASIAKQFKFPEINHGEDTDWATQIYKSGLIKSEYYTDKVLYHYLYKTKK